MNYGRYQIIKEIGKGSMGMVYQAHDPDIDRWVALKVLREDRLISETFVQRFLKEAKTIGRLSHPNIVSIYDVGQDHGTVYIAMEFLDGEPLNTTMAKERFGLEEVINLGIRVAETLDYAHQKGIVHRDIKPSNIIVQEDGQIKITDFGIAHIEDPSSLVQTQAGEILGTPAYMSPEQALSRPVDGRSDLFSLGIILYELSTGKRPFGGESLAAVFQAITQDTPPLPSKIDSSLPHDFSQIVMQCLDKNPDARFSTGKALVAALQGYLQGRGVADRVTPHLTPKPKRLSLLIVVVLILLGVGGGLSYYFITSKLKSPAAAVKVSKLAFLKAESTPMGAHVFVDGMFKGRTPIILELPPGKHELRLTLADYYDWEAQVQLQEEKETPLQVRLIPIEGKEP